VKRSHFRNLCSISLALATTLGAQTPVKPAKPEAAAAGAASALIAPCPPSDAECKPPAVPREFRAVWLTTVRYTDWPSKPGLSVAQQQQEMLTIMDRAQQVGMNAVIFQVRPAGDAFYADGLEPWSEFLTGKQGRAPDPAWDPLAFAVREAHARGMELHAWFNPYRAKEPSMKGPLAKSAFASTHPDLVKKYVTHLWMDPGEPAVRKHTVAVVLDVVKRYDIDGVHIDDYFYPYPEKRPNGSTDFPDDASWARYEKKGGDLSRDDWRRENVNQLIEELYTGVKKTKSWVKVGISPFGIWRPGNPESVKGFDAYEKLYADSKKWLENGWADYFTPQLYWAIDKEGQRYNDLLGWWIAQNSKGRHLWPGNYTSKVLEGGKGEWRRGEVLAQIAATRATPGATGNVHFTMEVFLKNRDSIGTALERTAYSQPALVPPSPWLGGSELPAPTLTAKRQKEGGTVLVPSVAKANAKDVRWWLVQQQIGGQWETVVLDGSLKEIVLAQLLRNPFVHAEIVAVSAVDRVGKAGAATVVKIAD
jgi:uncharacterized lipoprotein YddW (UPF0748 family)